MKNDTYTIFLAVHNRTARLRILHELELDDFSIVEASSGDEILKSFNTVNPDILILESFLPVIDGYTACTYLRKGWGNLQPSEIPVVFITSEDRRDVSEKVSVSGGSGFVTDSFKPGELLAELYRFLHPVLPYNNLEALVVDDEKITLHVVSKCISELVSRVYTVKTGEDAIALIKEKKDSLDLVILDYLLPGMNGDEVCRSIRRDFNMKDIPVIFLSGISERSLILEMFQAGATDYINKPFAAEDLHARLKNHLRTWLLTRRLRHSEENYRQLIESAPLGIISMDMKGSIIDINQKSSEILGSPSKNDTQAINLLAFPPLIKTGISADLKSCISTGNPVSGEVPYTSKWGKDLYLKYEICPVYNKDGTYNKVQAIFQDIMDSKRIQRSLEESEKKFRTLAESSPMAIIIFQDDYIVYANRAFEVLSGFPLEEVRSKPFWDYIHPEYRQLAKDRGQQRQNGKDVPFENFEIKIFTKSGDERWIFVAVETIDYNSRPAGIASMLDISNLKETEANLKRTIEEKEVLIREIHHRVKNNLQSVQSMISIQMKGISDDLIVSQLRDLKGRISTMTELHQILHNSDSINVIQLNTYIHNLAEYIINSHTDRSRNISLKYELDKEISIPTGKAIPCGLVLNELLTNAIKYAFPENREGIISLSLSSDNGTVRLQICDNGIGLPPDFNIEKSKSLGLKLIPMLASQLNGTVEFNSDSGLCCTLSFPS
ncbi:MAG TPA: response regulator [Spirochaetota bacterium]|nr:response regulator [Spirochaetota bacterium]